jgi:hypothetical protein
VAAKANGGLTTHRIQKKNPKNFKLNLDKAPHIIALVLCNVTWPDSRSGRITPVFIG